MEVVFIVTGFTPVKELRYGDGTCVYIPQKELRNYNEDLAKRPQVIAANKMDVVSSDAEDPIEKLKQEFEPQGIKVFPISAVSGSGIRNLLYYMSSLLATLDENPIVFEQEYFITGQDDANAPYTVEYDTKNKVYVIEGPRIEKMLGYTNLDSEKGFTFFQSFMKSNGILDELVTLGIQEGDTVKIYGHEFSYYR